MAREAAAVRVLHVAETAQGGVGSYVEEVASAQARRHGEGAVQVLLPREHALHFKRLPAGSLRCFDIAGAGRLRCMVRVARETWRIVRATRPDVVHIHSTYAGVVLRPLLTLMPGRPRLVYCAHGWAFDRRAPRWLNATVAWVERVCAHWCDAVVCISRHDQHAAVRAGLAMERLKVVLNGIADVTSPGATSTQPGLPWQTRSRRILFVGRLDAQKGVDVLYEAMRRLGDHAEAVVVGASVVGDEQSAEPPPNVRVTGWMSRDQIGALYDAAQVLVVPSRWEGFGLVALEAMRSGCAVVASRVGGLPEVVDDGVTGALFAPEDADALVALLTSLSDDQLAAMGRAGRERYGRLFHVDRVVDELDSLYREVLVRHDPARALDWQL